MATAIEIPTDPTVVGYGMGWDSTAMLIEMERVGWRPDLILFADTGSEKPETYAFQPIMDAWLARVGFPPIVVVKRASPRAGDTSLYGECVRKSVLPSLAYGMHSCSLKWKVDPQDRYCKRHFGWHARRQTWSHGKIVVKCIGYDAGPADARRVKNATGKWPPGYVYRYPLIEWGIDRARCAEIITAAGLPLPPKSACFFCPASKKHEILELRAEHPEMVDQAMEMERLAHERGLRSVAGLGRRFSWTDFITETEAPLPLFRQLQHGGGENG